MAEPPGTFYRYSQSGRSREQLIVKCYRSLYNDRANKFYFGATEPDPAMLTKAFGNYVTFNFASPEQFQVGNFTLSTGINQGYEGSDNDPGAAGCGYTIFRVENKYKVLMGAKHMPSCLIDIMSSKSSKNQLEISGIGSLYRAPCKITFYTKNGSLSNKVQMFNEYNWSGSTCHIK